MIPSVSLHLLTQDNSIPGNRKDGFRYHHLLFVVIVTPIYLWLELAFGVRLLDAMGAHVRIEETEAIGHSGRLISGAAVALFLLTGWFRQCEKKDLGLGKAALVSVLIVLLSFFVTWHVQELILKFYVKRSYAELPWAFANLAVLCTAGYGLYHLWLNKLSGKGRMRYLWLVLGAVLLLGLGYAQTQLLRTVDKGRLDRLGIERQQTATLTIYRRGLQEGLVTLPGGDHPDWALNSPEGKAYLALFPIFAQVYDQEAFAAERPRLIAELAYRDWDAEYGAQVFAGYQEVDQRLVQRYEADYLGSKRPLSLGERSIPPGLSAAQFKKSPAVQHYLRKELACFDCEFSMGMERGEFGRELFKWTRQREVQQAIDDFSTPETFKSGEWGDRAARTYWAPILALLFSMLGVFVHVFRLFVTLAAYRHRATFDRVGASDSPLANEVLYNSTRVTAAAIIGAVLFTYFSDNRITGDPGYTEHRPDMWRTRPIVGAIAAHWTVNAQGFIYPFTKKIRPDWLSFDKDPMPYIPIVNLWFQEDYR